MKIFNVSFDLFLNVSEDTDEYIKEYMEDILEESGATDFTNLTVTRLLPCYLPPKGWWCSRESGHSGPCAARQIGESI